MKVTKRIPFVDLIGLHEELKQELCAVFEAALKTGGFIGGPAVEAFEREFAAFCRSSHCIGVGSGTDALRFALIAAGIQPGEIVVTVPNTFIATTEAITQTGARPAFVDVDERTYNMDPEKLREYLDNKCTVDSRGRLTDKRTGMRIAAIVPVHLYGQMCDMDPILDLAAVYNLVVIEDACQAHGAEYFSTRESRWRRAGSVGRAAAFSFYPGKNLGACGDAGAVTTEDMGLAQRIRMLRDHGQVRKYHHFIEGYNGRLDAIQAGILRVKIGYLEAWNESRRAAAGRYAELLAQASAAEIVPHEPHWAKSVYHLYVARVANREALIQHLTEANVDTGIHYPVPLHLQKAYEYLGYQPGDFPVSERVCRTVLSLPMFPQITAEQQFDVVNQIASFLGPQQSGTLLEQLAQTQ